MKIQILYFKLVHASGIFRRFVHIFKLRYEITVCQIFILQSLWTVILPQPD